MSTISLIFDLDQTLVDSRLAEPYRRPQQWSTAYQKIKDFTLYDGITDVLNYVSREKIPFCIVTSSPSTYCSKVCQHWEISCNHMVCYHDTPKAQKPHPAPILLALEKLNLSPSKVLSCGDRDIDIISSNKAGVASVACLWGSNDTTALLAANPTYVAAIPALLGELITRFREESDMVG